MPSYQFGLSHNAIFTIKKVLNFFLFGLLLSPLLLSSRFFFPYITTKVFFFRLLVEMALALYVLVALADANYRPRWNSVSRAVAVFLAIVLFTSVFGANFYRSFWGNTERGEGILTLLHVAAFFFMLTGLAGNMRFWEKFFTFQVLVSFATAIYATLQKAGASFVISGDVTRVSALIGNASFYAGYLLINVFLAGWLFSRARHAWQKVAFSLIIVYELVILNLTGTRGAMLGLLVGILIVVLGLAATSRKTKVRLVLGVLLLVFMLSGFLAWAARDSGAFSPSGGIYRITHLSVGDITTQSRLLTWQAAWKGWQDRFFLGYGYENFNVPFNKYFPAAIFRDSGSQIWFDRAHNIFFDIATTTGVFGIGAYLSFYFLSFWMLYRHYRRDPAANRTTALLFTALLVSYFIQNLFVFDTLGTYIGFYSVLAFVAYLATPRAAPKAVSRVAYGRLPSAVPLFVCTLILFASWFTVFHPAAANTSVTEALVQIQKKDLMKTVDAYQKSISYGTYVTEEARQKLAESVIGFLKDDSYTPESKERMIRIAIEEMKRAVEQAPNDARNYSFLIAVYNSSISSEPGTREEVIRLGRQALELSPTRPQLYFEMGQAAFSLGRIEEGLGYFQKAVELNPFPAESHWNYGTALALAGRFDQADKEFKYALEPERVNNISDASVSGVIQIFLQKQQAQRALQIYEILLANKPKDAATRLNYANLLGQLCKLERAGSVLSEVAALSPGHETQLTALRNQYEQSCRVKK